MLPFAPLLVLTALAPGGDPLAPLPASEWSLEDARHLLDRAGFGGTPEEVRALFALGPEEAVRRLVRPQAPPLAFQAEPLRDRRALAARAGGMRWRDLDEEEKRALRRRSRREDRVQALEYRDFWLRRMIAGEAPLREKMALFWHGLLTSSQRQVRDSYAMAHEIELFRRAGLGSFRDLLHAVAKEPAMLVYLDGAKNEKGRPNENFAREVMELFTLGLGHYTEEDIHEAARAFTGWTVRAGEFRFSRRRHDDGEKTVLGRSGRFDGDDVLDILLDHEATARRLALRLVQSFVRPSPPEAVVDALARELSAHDLELAPALERLFRSRFFYEDESRGALVKSPVEFVVGLVRRLGVEPPPGPFLVFACDGLGQSLLDPPSVKGWEGGDAWVNSQTILMRANVARVLCRGLGARELRALRRSGGRGALGRALKRMKGWRPDFDVAAFVAGADTSQEAVARLSDRLLAVAPARGAVEEIRAHVAPFGDDAFDPEDPRTRRRLRDACWMLAALPEGQLE